MNDVTTYYVGKIYEKEVDGIEETERKYYSLGGGRFAIRDDGVLNWMLSDHLGSTSISTHADGSWRGEIAYTPFGEMRASRGMTLTNYRYTGQRLEAEVGLYFYQARWMDPVVGRFTQADTIIPDPGNPLSLDRYAYTTNNPVKYVDPSGHIGYDVNSKPQAPMIDGWLDFENYTSWYLPNRPLGSPTKLHEAMSRHKNNKQNQSEKEKVSPYEVKTGICGSQYYDPGLCTSHQFPYYGAQGQIISGPIENTGFGLRVEVTQKTPLIGIDFNIDLIYHIEKQQLDLYMFVGTEAGGAGTSVTGGLLLIQNAESNDDLINNGLEVDLVYGGGTMFIPFIPGTVGTLEYSHNPNSGSDVGVYYLGFGAGGEIGFNPGVSKSIYYHRIIGK